MRAKMVLIDGFIILCAFIALWVSIVIAIKFDLIESGFLKKLKKKVVNFFQNE
jgi:hypothetical protein